MYQHTRLRIEDEDPWTELGEILSSAGEEELHLRFFTHCVRQQIVSLINER